MAEFPNLLKKKKPNKKQRGRGRRNTYKVEKIIEAHEK
jgi:hypothetical protein